MNTPSHKLVVSSIENEVKLIIFTRDYFSQPRQRSSCTINGAKYSRMD